jgi:hypothetical protein
MYGDFDNLDDLDAMARIGEKRRKMPVRENQERREKWQAVKV